MLFPPGPLRRTTAQFIWISLAVFLFVGTAMSQAQSNAADLQGVVRDPNGAVVVDANVSARNTATNASREATTNDPLVSGQQLIASDGVGLIGNATSLFGKAERSFVEPTTRLEDE